ncbi:MAG: DUF2023 family protein [Bacteroides sp.]|jgi:hypothetical protein|nr:DUF2023 family protein [Bacteroides sp.]
MLSSEINPVELKVFLNHIYELKKGVRQMVLYTANKKYEDFAIKRLNSQKICYIIQPVGNDRINLFFGRKECINAIRLLITRPLNKLTPEEDFILGAVLGYDLSAQCKRFCERKEKTPSVLNQPS